MATYTTNLNLKKPAQTDFYDIADQNDNMDTLDAAVESKEPLSSVGTIRLCSSRALENDPRYLLCDGRCLLASDYPQLAGLVRESSGDWTYYGNLYLSADWKLYMTAAAYGNNTLVLLAQKDNSSYSIPFRSVYPTIWSDDTPVIRQQSSLIFYNGKFYSVGYEGFSYSSPDGAVWTQLSGLPSTSYMYSLAAGNGRMVCVGSEGLAYYCVNGTTWKKMGGLTHSEANPCHLNAVAYGNGRFVAVGNDGKSYYSTNGTSWVAMPGIDEELHMKGVTYGDGRFVSVGYNGGIYYSTNGTSWTAMTGIDGSTTVWSVTYGAGMFMAVGTYSCKAFVSTNGTSWTQVKSYQCANAREGFVSFMNGRFYWFYNDWYAIHQATMVPEGYLELPIMDDATNQTHGYLKITQG